METTIKFNPELGAVARSAFLIEKVHNCADCPIRRLAAQKQHSVFARMHAWHHTWWPGWQAYRARICARTVGINN